MQRGNEPGRPVPKMAGSPGVFPVFDQNGFKLEWALGDEISMNRIEEALFPPIPDQHDQMSLRGYDGTESVQARNEPLKKLGVGRGG